MKINKEGLELVKKFEGCKLSTYLCPAGVPTIGYGHTGEVDGKKLDGKKPIKITQKKADELLKKDLAKFEKAVENLEKKYGYKFNENQFSALVSFSFNLGEGSLLQVTRNGLRNKKEIATAMRLYNKANGQTLQGLVNRRIAEIKLYNKKVVKNV